VASASELVIAFVMGMGGSINWAMHGMVDIRLVLIILAGSLIGVQLGAIGTTYVKEYMIKVVMAIIMLIVALSRGFAIPRYLDQLGVTSIGQNTVAVLDKISFPSMCFAMLVGAIIILAGMWRARRSAYIPKALAEAR